MDGAPLTGKYRHPQKTFIGTCNNWTEDDAGKIKTLEGVNLLTIGKETGENGTPHLQWTITFKKGMRWRSLCKLLPRNHIEIARDASQCHNYCRKDNDYEIIDNRTGQGKRSDIDDFNEYVARGDTTPNDCFNFNPTYMVRTWKGQLARMEYRMPTRQHQTRGLFVTGEHGIGKSCWLRKAFPGARFISFVNNFYSGFSLLVGGNNILIFDDFDMSLFTSSIVKKLINHVECDLNVKNGFIRLCATLIIFVSNQSFLEWDLDDAARSRFQGNRGACIQFKKSHVNGTGRVPSDIPRWAVGKGPAPGSTFDLPSETDDDFEARLFPTQRDVAIVESGSESDESEQLVAVDPLLRKSRLRVRVPPGSIREDSIQI